MSTSPTGCCRPICSVRLTDGSSPSQAHRLSERYHIVMWDVLSRDYSHLISPRTCLHNVTKHVKGGSIVVFHDSVKSFRNLHGTRCPCTLDFLYERGLKCSVIEL